MSETMQAMCGDLAAEHLELAMVVEGLPEDAWDRQTPAAGWTVRDQIAHLAFFDEKALEAHVDPVSFVTEVAALAEEGDLESYVAVAGRRARAMSGPDVLAWWAGANAGLRAAFENLDPTTRIAWYGPPMAARSKITARIMETWAHGLDVREALGRIDVPTGRLRHVCHIGVRARAYSFGVRGLDVPEVEPFVTLAHEDETWTWGDPSSPEMVRGSALSFALVATQRRHRSDSDLEATGPGAAAWLDIAQAFAGPAGPGRPPIAG
ncbi:MAG: TIGR03084 family metal-binding protein [Acidimicrobiia bacterium]